MRTFLSLAGRRCFGEIAIRRRTMFLWRSCFWSWQIYAAVLNFTFAVTGASITTSGTSVSVSGPASLTVSGIGTDTGTFSGSGSLANVTGGNVTVPFMVTLRDGTFGGNMTFPLAVLAGSGQITGSYHHQRNRPVCPHGGHHRMGSGFTGSVLAGGRSASRSRATPMERTSHFPSPMPPSSSGDQRVLRRCRRVGRQFGRYRNVRRHRFPQQYQPGQLDRSVHGHARSRDTDRQHDFPGDSAAELRSGQRVGHDHGGTGSYAGYSSSSLTASGTVTGSVLSGGTLSFSVLGTINSTGPARPASPI